MRVHLALGNLYYGSEKWDQAIKHYRIVIDDPHPDQELVPSAMSNLIETYEVAAAYDGGRARARCGALERRGGAIARLGLTGPRSGIPR